MENVARPQRVTTRVVAPVVKFNLSSIVAWAAIFGLVALVVGALTARAGGLLTYLYPATAFAVGALLYWRHPALYLGFVWWLWFLTPEVRRLIDYQFGWNPLNPVMLAPYLVTALTFFTLLHHLPKLQFYRLFPFGLVFLGLFYAYSVGLYRGVWQAATYDLLVWLVPVVFAFHLVVHWRNYPRFRRAIQRTFVWGVLVMGLYGVLQFVNPPVWDQYWMSNAPMASFGEPEPFQVRVFSTLNSGAPFATVMMAGLLLLSAGGGPLRWPAAGVGYVSFLLSLARFAWGSWLVGLSFMAVQRGRSSPRLLVGLVVMGLIALPLLTVGPVADVIEERLQTITELQQDVSFKDRQEFYSTFAPHAFLNPAGVGLGTTGLATKLSTGGEALGEFGIFDSGLMHIPFVLGWPGSLLYIAGLAWLLFYALRSGGSHSDPFAVASRGIAVAVLAMLPFHNALIGVEGMVFWSFLGLSLAARVYQSRVVAQTRQPRMEPARSKAAVSSA